MLNHDVRPTTLEGIKRLAAELRRKQGIKHSLALDLAAKAANYENFRNARRMLDARGDVPTEHYVLLTRYWLDRKQRQNGRETLRVKLPMWIRDICGKGALKHVRGFQGLRVVADDHLVCDLLDSSQSYARERLFAAERSLHFMEYTGLRPALSRDARKAYPRGSTDLQLPYSDHSTLWIDPAHNQFILVDEPYALAPDNEARAAWAARHNWQIVKTSYPGMYRPYECDLYVATDGGLGYDLGALVANIDTMPTPRLEEDWPGDTSPSWETFTSPLARTVQDVRRARCRGTIFPVPSATTVPYSYSIGASRRRPDGQMKVAEHIEAGRIIKAVIHSKQRPYAAYRRLSSLRSTLEDWMSLEIDKGELDGPEFFEVYYTEAEGDALYREVAKSPGGIVTLLAELRQKLSRAYPNCAPLRQQLRRIDMAVSLVNKMKSVAA